MAAEDDEVGASVLVVTVRLAARGEDTEVDVGAVAHTPVAGMSVALRLVPCTTMVDAFEVDEVEDEVEDEDEEAGWCWALRNTSCSCFVRR